MLYASCNRCNVLCRAIVNEHGNDSLPVWGLYAPVLMKIGPEELQQALWLSHLRFFKAQRQLQLRSCRSEAEAGPGNCPVFVESIMRSILKQRAVPSQLRSAEHTSELQSLMRNSYAVFCLKKTKKILNT